jgi:2-polyprenyl-3-methyl-5-hydroxy-6-metoxy-1,4-benzoquinol methylase
MSTIIHYSQCPVCGSDKIAAVFSAKDHTITKENFSVWHCNNCSLRFTQDVPDQQNSSRFYQSEEYISHSDTGKGIINKLYHLVRKTTLADKRRLIEKKTSLKNGIILDVGSGTGAFLNEMKQNSWQVMGLEPDPKARMIASERYNIALKQSTELYNLNSESFDVITLWHVLEHVHDLHGYIIQLKRVLKPTGKIFIAVPNYTSPDADAYKEYWAAYDVPRHLYHFSPTAMDALMRKHGLKIISYKPMWYDSFYVSLLSSKYKNGKPSFIGAGFTGFLSNLSALWNVKRCSSIIYIISK